LVSATSTLMTMAFDTIDVGYICLVLPLVGSITCYLAVLTWPIENNETTCNSRVPVFIIGFALMMVSVSVRLDIIFLFTRLLQFVLDDAWV
jgi:hypothetical protein